MNVSGACCAFRRAALRAIGGSASTRGEDLDNSLMLRKAGWKLCFRPRAILRTEVPETVHSLARQRVRWDRDFVQLVRKHRDLLNPRLGGWLFAWEMLLQIVVNIVLPFACVLWLGYMLARAPGLLVLVLLVSFALGAVLSTIALAVSARASGEWRLVAAGPLLPLYATFLLGPVRLWSTACELLRIRREDPFLPQSYWRNAPLP
jgi:cellulose synthase/poly-beta-1,6-N-acetylglucosamine synthase-like glycosyltransferase